LGIDEKKTAHTLGFDRELKEEAEGQDVASRPKTTER
jgi:hypothetical protein